MYSQEEKDKMAMKNSTIDKFGDRYGVNDTSPKQQQRIGRIAENNKDRAERVAGRIVDRNTRVERGATMDAFSKNDRNDTRTTAQNRRIGRIAENNKDRAEKVMNRIDDRNYQKLNKQTFAEKKEAKMQKRQDVGSAIVKKKEEKQASQAKTDRLGRIYKAGGDINKKIYDDF